MSRHDWPTGLVTALVTPMTDEGIDTTATQRLVERQVQAGVGGVLVAGGTGEHGVLTLDERALLTRTVAEALDGRLPFVVQTGALATRDAVRLSQDAQAIGAAGVLLPAPFGEAVNWREKLAFYAEVNDAVSVPIMLYNTHSAGIMNLAQVAELAQLPNVSAIKHSSSDATLLGDLIAWSATADFAVYTGWDDQLAPAVLAGAHGALLGAGNVVPELIVEVLDLCYRHELGKELDAAWGRLRPFLRFIGESENYVSTVKLGAQLRGLDVGDVRRPYQMPLEAEREALVEALRVLDGAGSMTHVLSIDRVDVLVVGAGPAGAVASHTLATRGFSVVCLEQGDWVNPGDMPGTKPEFELLTRGEWSVWPNERKGRADYPLNVDDADADPIMFNGVGGGSVFYGAHWMRLLPSDFRVRSVDGVCDDWPIGYEDLAPFYDQVDRFIGVSGLGGDPAYPEHDYPLPPHPLGPGGVQMAHGMNELLGWHWWPGTNAIPSTAFKNMGQCVRWGLCERGCPVGAKASFDLAYWPHATAAGAKLVTGARVARITVDNRGLANGAIWIDVEGAEHRVEANAVVLAGNGIGTPRILLMSNEQQPDGLANSSGLVGKNLMLHPVNSVLGAYEEELAAWYGPAGQLIYSLEFADTDRSRGFLRGAKWALMPPLGVLHVLDHLQNHGFDEKWGARVHELAAFTGRSMIWSGVIDDLPEESNAVVLDPSSTDSSGLPGVKLNYRRAENADRMVDFMNARMVEAHEAAGAVRTLTAPLTESGHLLGTARLGADPRTSVVDAFGRSHDVPNLFIVDGSVMVTGGSVNPTATIAALSLRTATHLADTARDQRVPA